MYFRQIDALRAIAVSLVVFAHWGPQNAIVMRILPYGFLGVNLFFVISGFLITRILINSYYINGYQRIATIKSFFVRRALRIFPLYYLTLLFFIVINYQNIRHNLSPYIFYYCNFDYYFDNKMHGELSPRWSLAVEEQFYVLWPFLILFLNKLRLKKFLVFIIVFALFSRTILVSLFPENEYVQFLIFSNLDSLGSGGLLAFVYIFHKEKFKSIVKYSYLITLLGIALLLMYSFYHFNESYMGIIPVNLKAIGCTLISFGLVTIVLDGVGGTLGNFMNSNGIVFIGKISYGLYLYHSMIYLLMDKLNIVAFKIFPKEALAIILLVTISSFSWYFFEKPINNLKRHFPY